LNLRNAEGKSPLFLALEHSRQSMFDDLFDQFSDVIDFRSKDTMHGDTPLHIACL
jgi:ankyrin repeat protein